MRSFLAVLAVGRTSQSVAVFHAGELDAEGRAGHMASFLGSLSLCD